MTGERDTFEFSLAAKLGKTIHELRESLTEAEYLQWAAYYTWRNAMDEFEMKKAISDGGTGTGNRN